MIHKHHHVFPIQNVLPIKIVILLIPEPFPRTAESLMGVPLAIVSLGLTSATWASR